LFYGTTREFLDGTVRFVRHGLASGEPVLVALPRQHADLLCGALGSLAASTQFIDMFELGRNPARIIPRVRAFLALGSGAPARFVSEPLWQGQSSAQIREAARHDAQLNVVFATTPLRVLCTYDWTRLAQDVIADAGRTHPELVVHGERRPSVLYPAPPVAHDGASGRLPSPPPDATLLSFTRADLSVLVEVIWRAGTLLQLQRDRVRDLMYAASEVAMSTFADDGSASELRLWKDPEHLGLVCEFRTRATSTLKGGLWLVNQHCDLLEVRSDRSGTTVRLHARP
jgi:hypothetical protein